MKKVDRDPFGSGTEHDLWESNNCDRCWKSSRYKGENCYGEDEYTKVRCAIQRDIFTRMFSSEPIYVRTIRVCRMWNCPYRQEKRPKYVSRKNKDLPSLF